MLPAFISQRGCHTCTWIGLVMVRSIMLQIKSHFMYGQELNIIIIIISSFVLDLRSHKQQQAGFSVEAGNRRIPPPVKTKVAGCSGYEICLCAPFFLNKVWMGIQEVFSNFPLVWRNPLTRFQLESTTDYCRKLFDGSTVVTIGLRDLYQSHQSVNHEMSTFKWTSPNFYTPTSQSFHFHTFLFNVNQYLQSTTGKVHFLHLF